MLKTSKFTIKCQSNRSKIKYHFGRTHVKHANCHRNNVTDWWNAMSSVEAAVCRLRLR